MVLVCEMFLYLLTARTRCFQILLAVPFDFRLAALTALDFVTKFLQPMGQLRAINRRRILLRFVEFPWLQGMGFAVLCLGEIEKDDVRVQLWCSITIDRPCAVMLELRCYPFAGGLCRKIAPYAGLDISLQLVKCDANAFSMRFSDTVVSTYQGGQRYALRG